MEFFLGEIRIFPWGDVPEGWLPCDGRILNIREYQALYSLIGNDHGGDGRLTFALPNLCGRAIVGAGMAPGLSNYAIAEKGGQAEITLSDRNLPAHGHELVVADANADQFAPLNHLLATITAKKPFDLSTYAPKGAVVEMDRQSVLVAGDAQPQSNMQPYTALNICISVVGIYQLRNDPNRR